MKLIDIHSPQDIKPLTIDDLKDLAKQMRAAIINYTSTIGGHVGPNLGDVEALIGVHYVFDAPKDKIVIDVSHQDFVHKMLTGRAQYYLDKGKFTEIGEFTTRMKARIRYFLRRPHFSLDQPGFRPR